MCRRCAAFFKCHGAAITSGERPSRARRQLGKRCYASGLLIIFTIPIPLRQPKITILLQREGHKVSERTVGKYMRELGLCSCVAKKFRVKTTDSNHDLPIAPNC
ncbi:IS3 family transposase [Paenibacillus sp. FSL P4-0081]|uniref:IS3 family transposase n=1 Tax=unclassified Paenibacillus TaxID=185978 RepID=UPI0018CDD2BF